MTLAELQASFHALATRTGTPPSRPEDLLVDTPTLGAAERLRIYADMYLVRQIDALREAFPATAAVLGDAAFHALVESYVAAHPSENPDLGQLGRRLAGFLRAHPTYAPRDDLADLAALEWARSEVFFEAARASVGREALTALAPEAFAASCLRLVPTLRLVLFRLDPLPLWRAIEEQDDLPPPARSAAAAAVWRPELDVVHAALPLDEAEALRRALAGSGLAEVCDAFAGRATPVEDAFAALASWVDEGWVTRVERLSP